MGIRKHNNEKDKSEENKIDRHFRTMTETHKRSVLNIKHRDLSWNMKIHIHCKTPERNGEALKGSI